MLRHVLQNTVEAAAEVNALIAQQFSTEEDYAMYCSDMDEEYTWDENGHLVTEEEEEEEEVL